MPATIPTRRCAASTPGCATSRTSPSRTACTSTAARPSGDGDPAWQASAAAERAALLDRARRQARRAGPRRRAAARAARRAADRPQPLHRRSAHPADADRDGSRPARRRRGGPRATCRPTARCRARWSSTSGAAPRLRTGGEEIAQGLALMGCRPIWDHGHRPRHRRRGAAAAPHGPPARRRDLAHFRPVPRSVPGADRADRRRGAGGRRARRRRRREPARRRGAPPTAMAPRSPASSAPRPAPTAPASRSCSASDGDRADARRGLSRRRLARLWRRRRRGHARCPARFADARRRRRSSACTAATIPAAICSKAPRTPPSSAALPRPPPRSAATPISSCSTPPIRSGRARAPLDAALARIVRGRADQSALHRRPDAPRPARRGRARRDRRPAGRFRRDDRRGVERAVRSACTTPISPTRACATSCCGRTPLPRAPSPSGSTRRGGTGCGIRAATTSTPASSAAPKRRRRNDRKASSRRGACPGLSAPMQTGDGLLVRLIVRQAAIPLDAFAGALRGRAHARQRHRSRSRARGSIQVRGLDAVSAPLFAAAVGALEIDGGDGVPVLADPLPDDPAALIDAQALAAALRSAIARRRAARSRRRSRSSIDGGGRICISTRSPPTSGCAPSRRATVHASCRARRRCRERDAARRRSRRRRGRCRAGCSTPRRDRARTAAMRARATCSHRWLARSAPPFRSRVDSPALPPRVAGRADRRCIRCDDGRMRSASGLPSAMPMPTRFGA